MTNEFEQLTLKYLTTDRSSVDLLEKLKPEIYKFPKNVIYAQLLTGFYKKFNTQPTNKDSVVQFLHNAAEKQNIPADTVTELEDTIILMFSPIPVDVQMTRETLIPKIIANRVEDIIIDSSAKGLSNLTLEALTDFKDGIDAAFEIGKTKTEKINDFGKPMFASPSLDNVSIKEGISCKFKSVNSWRNSGGFVTPELIMWMSGPKSFKTGTLVNLAVDHLMDGLPVYYVDTENGRNAIETRIYQTLMHTNTNNLRQYETKDRLLRLLKAGSIHGMEIVVDNYGANRATIDGDVRARLRELKKLYNFEPKVIIWDYLDNFVASNKDFARNKTTNTQGVYPEATNLHGDIGAFGHTASQVHRAAVGKKIFTSEDVSYDYAKFFNCHASFAICATDLEIEANEARIHIVMQRDGLRPSLERVAPVKIDFATHQIYEVDFRIFAEEQERRREELQSKGYTFNQEAKLISPTGELVYPNPPTNERN